MVSQREIKIKKQFDEQGRDIVSYIRKNSIQNAQKFIDELDRLIDKIVQNPEIYPPERFLPTKQNLYRFVIVMKSWKIIFKLTNERLVFIGIIHTAMHPNKIKQLRTGNYE